MMRAGIPECGALLIGLFEKLATGNWQLTTVFRTRETAGQNRGMCTQVVYVETVDVSAHYLVIPRGGAGPKPIRVSPR